MFFAVLSDGVGLMTVIAVRKTHHHRPSARREWRHPTGPMGPTETTMPWDYSDRDDYDGPSPAWEARQRRASARRPLCDEHGTPLDEDCADDDGEGGEE